MSSTKTKSNPTPDPVANPANLLARAQDLIAADRYGELVALTSKALAALPNVSKNSKTRATLAHLQVVALVRLERYQDALRLLSDIPDLVYERAYCLYRTNQLHDALALLDSMPLNRKVLLLKAQVLYRLERFPDCLAIYDSLLEDHNNDNDNDNDNADDDWRQDLVTNRQAVLASMHLSTLSFTPATNGNDLDDTLAALADLGHFSSYEHCYNTATTALAQGHLPLAKAALDHARRLATLTLADSGLSQRDLALELQPVLVQLAYAHHVAGDLDAAAQLYRMVLSAPGAAHTPDWAVALNNLAAIDALHPSAELKDVQRKFNKIHKHAAVRPDRMPRWQRLVVQANEALVNGFPTAAAAAGADKDAHENVVLHTMRALATGKPLPERASAQPLATSVYVTLAHVQRHLESTPAAAASSPETLAAVLAAHNVDTLPAARALYARALYAAGHVDAATQVLAEIGTPDAREQVAQLLARSPGRAADAAQVWAQLVAQDPTDVRRVAEWVRAEARVDPVAAQEHAAGLVSALANVDDTLGEELDPDTAWKPLLVATPAAATNAAAPAPASHARRRRRPRYPKHADPTSAEFLARQPDPERWVPKHLRKAALAAAKKKADKAAKRGKAAGITPSGHQGGPIADDPGAPQMTGLGGTGSARIFGSRGGQAQAAAKAGTEEPAVVASKPPSAAGAGGNKKKAAPAKKKGGRK